LVRPVGFDARKVIGVAHYTQHIVEATQNFDSLPDAVHDSHLVIGLTGRHVRAERNALPLPEAVHTIVDAARNGQRVAVVLGREDFGLSTAALDACHMVTTIPTNPAYPSLNLAQATLLVLYQCFQQAGGQEQAYRPPRHAAPPASSSLLDDLFADLERALDAIEFLHSRSRTHTLRSLRVALYRARMNVREASLLRAVVIEIRRFLQRRGVLPEIGPVGSRPAAGLTRSAGSGILNAGPTLSPPPRTSGEMQERH
jgi:TrmH family RNA methyltransferase